jgi:signal transduction histidine kinase
MAGHETVLTAAFMLHEFIALNRSEIIRRCRAKVSTRSLPPPTLAEIDHGVPLFLDQLGAVLRDEPGTTDEISKAALQHGHDLLRQGFTVSQVVHDYGDVCQSITELAVETEAPISTEDFRTLNRCLDDAIAGAVTEYGRERNQSTFDGASTRGTERLGFFAHELGNLINTGIVAFEILKTGNVGVGGSTGAVLHRSLMGLRALVTRSLTEIHLAEGVHNRQPVPIATLIDELSPSAVLEASARGVTLDVVKGEEDATILADRAIISAVITNLLQNALKFTARHSTVTLRIRTTAERVLVEVEDRCGGLPEGNADDLFRPFEQRGADRSGVGLGLAFCLWAVQATDGRIYARDLPGTGCVFTIDLPRAASAVLAVQGSASR